MNSVLDVKTSELKKLREADRRIAPLTSADDSPGVNGLGARRCVRSDCGELEVLPVEVRGQPFDQPFTPRPRKSLGSKWPEVSLRAVARIA
jgi:hypothetical protein